jgi:xanthine dehydrogenase YagS FAD-binding subunit
MKPFQYIKAADTATALFSAKKQKSQYVAGGTNQVDLMKDNINYPDTLIDITTALSKNITVTDKGIIIGAMVRNSTIANDKTVKDNYPLLAKAILAGASPQIRNMASTGGNLLQRTRCPYFFDTALPCNKRKPGSGCSAIKGDNRMSAIIGTSAECIAVHPSDMCIALAALDATVQIVNKDASKQNIAFKDFHRLPGTTPNLDNNLPENGLITEIKIPANNFYKNYSYLKLRDRDSYAFALVSVAAALDMNGDMINEARLASGGVAHKPWRWYDAEAFLKGKKATPSNFTQAAAIATKGTKGFEHNAFKIPMLKAAIEVALTNCITV